MQMKQIEANMTNYILQIFFHPPVVNVRKPFLKISHRKLPKIPLIFDLIYVSVSRILDLIQVFLAEYVKFSDLCPLDLILQMIHHFPSNNVFPLLVILVRIIQ